MAGVVGQTGVVDPLHLGVGLQIVGHGCGVLDVPVHAQGQGLQPLQDQEAVEGRDGRACVAQQHRPHPADIGRRAQRLGIDHAVIGHLGLVQAAEARLVLGPGEVAAVDDGPADAGAVAADILGQGVDDDVGAVLDRAGQVGGRHGVVDDQRQALGVGRIGQGGEVHDIAQRIADGLAEDRLGALIGVGGDGGDVVGVDEAHLDAVLGQGVGEQVVGAAIEGAGGDDVVAGLGDGQDGVGDGRHARGHGQGRDPALQRRQTLLQHVGRRVHDAGVDIARHLQVEQVGPVLGVVEGVAGGLIDRHRDRLGRRVGRIAGVDGERVELHAFPRGV
ncbi:hypothetical protein D3C72_1153100 [compost metagenome]